MHGIVPVCIQTRQMAFARSNMGGLAYVEDHDKALRKHAHYHPHHSARLYFFDRDIWDRHVAKRDFTFIDAAALKDHHHIPNPALTAHEMHEYTPARRVLPIIYVDQEPNVVYSETDAAAEMLENTVALCNIRSSTSHGGRDLSVTGPVRCFSECQKDDVLRALNTAEGAVTYSGLFVFNTEYMVVTGRASDELRQAVLGFLGI